MISHFFIDRPIFASVVSIVIIVVGLVSLHGLPIAQFPEITPPQVQIETDYPGASAEVVADSVARTIEVQLPGIDHLLYYDSTSTNDGHMTIRLTFDIGTDIDIAQVQTQNREKLAEPRIPSDVIRQGITVKKVSPDLLTVIALNSSDRRYDNLFLANYAILRIVDDVKRLPGVGDAYVFGQQDYSMRLILDPVRMAQLNLTPTDITNIVREQNRDFPAGQIGREPAPKGTELTIPVITLGRMTDVKEFEEMIVRALPNGSMIRMKDIAKVELGSQSYALEGRQNAKPNVFLLTFLEPGANALDTAKRIRAKMAELAQSFPSGVNWDIPYDTTRFVEVSIEEVIKTLSIAMVLVILVVYLFLQSWRTTLIPAVAVPVSLIGTFAGMAGLGFSINTLTLFGLILAIGIVVDDAIVVVENVQRHMAEECCSAKEAAKRAMNEVTAPIIAIVLAIRDHDCDLRDDFRVRRADAQPRPVRPRSETRGAGSTHRFFRSLQYGLRLDARSLYEHGRTNHPAGGASARDLWGGDRPRLRTAQGNSSQLPARRGPRLLYHRHSTARWRIKAADRRGARQSGKLLSLAAGHPFHRCHVRHELRVQHARIQFRDDVHPLEALE